MEFKDEATTNDIEWLHFNAWTGMIFGTPPKKLTGHEMFEITVTASDPFEETEE